MNPMISRTLTRLALTLSLLGALLVGVHQPASAAAVIYVNAAATGANNGTSWATAYKNLQKVLSTALPGEEIWVAKGTYKPTSGTDRTKTFVIQTGVAVYGGFAGTETSLSQRNTALNLTVLSGDIGLASTADNSYHVVSSAAGGADNTAILDGFTIMDGNADGLTPNDTGGGIYLLNATPTLNNLAIVDNHAAADGGGIYSEGGGPSLTADLFSGNVAGNRGGGMFANGSPSTFKNVTFGLNSAAYGGGLANGNSSDSLTGVSFQNNTAATLGGGMYNNDNSNATLAHVTFSANKTTDGGGAGMFNGASSPTLLNVVFNGNKAVSAGSGGGGMYNYNGSNATLLDVTFGANTAGFKGGGMWNENSSPTVVNVTFHGNTASSNGGGGMYNYASAPTLRNTTFNGNSAAGNGDGLFNFASSFPTIDDSIFWGDGTSEIVYSDFSLSEPPINDSVVQGGQPSFTLANNLIAADPKLGPLAHNGGFTMTQALGPGSAAIDAGGLNSTCAARDQRVVARPQGDACDIGAYEVRALSFSSAGAQDGYVVESGKATNLGGPLNTSAVTLLVGDNSSDRRYRGFLSFDTSNIPDPSTVAFVKLKLLDQANNGDPFASQGKLVIDQAQPYFGAELGLVNTDWQAGATVSPAGSFGSTLLPVGSWYTAALNAAGRAAINKTGTTQFRLRFKTENYNSVADNLSLYSGNALGPQRPVLIVYYNP